MSGTENVVPSRMYFFYKIFKIKYIKSIIFAYKTNFNFKGIIILKEKRIFKYLNLNI